jgi:hypothetical protein
MRDVTPPRIEINQQQLECVKCGAQTAAVCNCGMSYRQAAVRVAEYDKANPGQSTRQAAAELGVSNSTVSEARKAGVRDRTPVNQLTPETVTGRDGKTYQAKRQQNQMPVGINMAEPPKTEPGPIIKRLGHEIIDVGFKALADRFQDDKPTMDRLEKARDELRYRLNEVEWF